MEVKIYGPEVNLSRMRGSNKAFVEESSPHIASIMADDPEPLIRDCQVIVLGARDADVEASLRATPSEARVVVDLVGVSNPDELGGECHGVCW